MAHTEENWPSGRKGEAGMKLYSIMPLLEDHLEEECRDIAEQYRTGVATDVMMYMPLMPEGDPTVDKAGIACRVFDRFQDRLKKDGVSAGVLVQQTIGHGNPLNHRPPFQPYVRLEDGVTEYITCPYDEGFRAYIRQQLHTVAAHGPREIMVDDDLRLMHRWGRGCACPLHLAEVSRRAGRTITREDLWAHTQGDSPEDERISKIFIETQKDAVLGAARAIRAGIDEVDPSLPGSFCGAGEAMEFAAEIAEILAGKGNPVVVRLNNDNYHAPGPHELSNCFYKAAMQTAVLNGRADVILAETDTCPHTRYSTAARMLHAHFTGSILEGAAGAKHWVTYMTSWEPETGRAYRRMLSEHRGFYDALSALVPALRWEGCRIPVSTVPDYGLKKKDIWGLDNDGWSGCVLERLGLPLYFSPKDGGAVFLDGDADKLFSDEQIRAFFRGPVFLASDTAMRLCARGFRELLGVDVREWEGPNPSGEILSDGTPVTRQKHPRELLPLSDDVRADSTVYHLRDGRTKEPIFPGCTVYRNGLGGMSVVFCGTPKAQFHWTEGFGFLNPVRKRQLARLLQECGCLPVWIPGDEEAYFRAAETPEGELFCAVFNIGLDPIHEIRLRTDRPVASVRRLMPDGTRSEIPFRREGEDLVLETPAWILDPAVLFLS